MTSSAGRPTADRTIIRVTSPAWGTPAAPMLAKVAVTLKKVFCHLLFAATFLKRLLFQLQVTLNNVLK